MDEPVAELLRRHALSLVLWALAAALVVFSLGRAAPEPEELTQISGVVQRADPIERCPRWRFCKTAIIVTIDGLPGRYHIRPPHPAFLPWFHVPHTSVRTYIRRQPTEAQSDDEPVETWGLWVNGTELVSLEDALSADAFMRRSACPVLAVIIATLGIARFFRE